ncbi:MAG: phosphomannomutase [Deltaproteobacteria bacterium]|jgi:phosphomannomutase|nr:phosphomannomutase [Deltaproteobacteria bacterium]MBW2533813.1 phosphomannomutase [Deltaproteobacteria bacterium]
MCPNQADRPAPPAWLAYEPTELRFGTSGLRGRVAEMTDLEIYINARGFLEYLQEVGDATAGEPIAIAEDLRREDPKTGIESSPRIARAVVQAIADAGFAPLHYGCIPTPALAYQAGQRAMASVMVTGSHIPADRNGVKFYKKGGEVLKADEGGILAAVRRVRAEQYAQSAAESAFDERGALRAPPESPGVDGSAAAAYVERYTSLFAGRRPLSGRRIVVYEHSAVGRDLLTRILDTLGAETIGVDRSDAFVSVDTEDVTAADEARFRRYVEEHRPDAVVSTDGDSDRPLVIDEQGRFHRGDVLGIVTAELVGARFAVVPISTSDALDLRVAQQRAEGGTPLRVRKTRIGSPYVIAAMHEAAAEGIEGVVGWEANGGFLTATDVQLGDGVLTALATRDAMLPILAALLCAADRAVPLSRLFDELPPRATRAGLLDDFPPDRSRAILAQLRPGDADVVEVVFQGGAVEVARSSGADQGLATAPAELASELHACRQRAARFFGADQGFGPVERMSFLDGVRIWFAGGDVAHLRPSGNAPQFRIYAVSDTQQRADAIVAEAIAEPNGQLRRMERELASA